LTLLPPSSHVTTATSFQVASGGYNDLVESTGERLIA